jgi:hypothetical protein
MEFQVSFDFFLVAYIHILIGFCQRDSCRERGLASCRERGLAQRAYSLNCIYSIAMLHYSEILTAYAPLTDERNAPPQTRAAGEQVPSPLSLFPFLKSKLPDSAVSREGGADNISTRVLHNAIGDFLDFVF